MRLYTIIDTFYEVSKNKYSESHFYSISISNLWYLFIKDEK